MKKSRNQFSIILVITAFVFTYLHRRLELFSSSLIIIGIFSLYLPFVIVHLKDMIKDKKFIGNGLIRIYSLGLFCAAATFFVWGKSTFDLATEAFSVISLLIAGITIWLHRKSRTKKTTNLPFDGLIAVLSPLIAVIAFIALNYK